MRPWFQLLLVASFCFTQLVAREIDHHYAPANAFSLICLPDDWQKSVVTRSGALGYDFGPGPYARPLTLVSIDVVGESTRVVRQWLPDGRIPVVHTRVRTPTAVMEQVAFALIPQKETNPTGIAAAGQVRRIGGLNGCRDWANPPAPCDPLFRSVAWGTNRPILYHIKVQRGAKVKVALGFCEPYKSRPGSRNLECRVEGALRRIVDPLQSGIQQTPHVELFDGCDENWDGQLTVEIHPVPGSDPNVILHALWLFPDTSSITSAEIASGNGSSRASLAYGCGLENEETVPSMRCDALVASVQGEQCTPRLRIQTRLSLSFDSHTRTISADGHPFLFCRPAPDTLVRNGSGYSAPFPHGTRRVEVVALHGKTTLSKDVRNINLDAELKRARHFWENDPRIPQSPITIGDSSVQFLIQASLRNLYQAREKADGHLQFQPGPSVYRGLWVADVVLSGIPSLMFGDTRSLRLMLENAFRIQLPSGQIKVITPVVSLSETPIVLTAAIWYSWMTGDNRWLKRHWESVRNGIRWIKSMREQTLLDVGSPYQGLMPPGFVDGGISNLTADYGTVLWSVTALEVTEEAAQRLGYESDAREWEELAQQLQQSLERSMTRDARHDKSGNIYLPVAVGDTSTTPPERGQYALLLPLRYGPFLQRRTPQLDSLIRGNLRMLEATEVEGLISNSGWLSRGLWPWLGSAHAMAYQVLDDPERAADVLYAAANHATEAGTWVEEQLPKDLGTTWTGDGSNAEASGMFLHLVRNSFLFERLDTLHCLASVPPEWFQKGTKNEIRHAPTLFGPVSLAVAVAGDGDSAIVKWSSTRKNPGAAAVLHTYALRAAGFHSMDDSPIPDRITLTLGKTMQFHFRRQ
jgi:hypothetical protein